MAVAAAALWLVPRGSARADDDYLLAHPDAAWWLSAQVNVIGQAQPGFHAPYSGDHSFASARGENAELELHDAIAGQPGTVRLLGFANHARMGRYADAIAAFQRGETAAPDVTASRAAGRITYGAGLDVEHSVTDQLRGFARLGWNSGHDESFAYTEVDNTVALGADLRGAAWHRGGDQLGVAAVSSGLSDAHRRYLALGGKGFLLGDGQLRYGRELVVETYYTARLWRGIAAAGDVQLIGRPGFNRDRGPVAIGSLRLHVDL